MEGQARGGNKGREQAMILCRERASVEEGRVEGTSEEAPERLEAWTAGGK